MAKEQQARKVRRREKKNITSGNNLLGNAFRRLVTHGLLRDEDYKIPRPAVVISDRGVA